MFNEYEYTRDNGPHSQGSCSEYLPIVYDKSLYVYGEIPGIFLVLKLDLCYLGGSKTEKNTKYLRGAKGTAGECYGLAYWPATVFLVVYGHGRVSKTSLTDFPGVWGGPESSEMSSKPRKIVDFAVLSFSRVPRCAGPTGGPQLDWGCRCWTSTTRACRARACSTFQMSRLEDLAAVAGGAGEFSKNREKSGSRRELL